MNITSDDAAVVYARACWVWYGPKAARVVRTRIEELRRVGDRAGVPQVAEKLPQLIERPISGSVGQRHRYEAPQTVAGGEKRTGCGPLRGSGARCAGTSSAPVPLDLATDELRRA